MKLSEAIRLGAMMGPQVFREYVGPLGMGTCAIGGALQVCGHSATTVDEDEIWPWLRRSAECPVGDCCNNAAGAVIIHLNDEHRWTREQIADWVATIEPEEVHASETNGQCSLGKGDYERTGQEAVSQDEGRSGEVGSLVGAQTETARP